MRRFIILLVIAGVSVLAAPNAVGVSEPQVIAAVGDMACPPGTNTTATACHQNQVGALVASENPAAFLPLGDEQYNNGALSLFQQSYDKAFGQLYPISKPVPGNHEYLTANAQGYRDYFNTGTGPLWYSYDIGSWHVVALDSDCGKIGGCGMTKPQGQWLKADLVTHPVQCTLAYWHHPRFNSGEHGGATNMTWAWRLLYNANAELVLNGHEHSYQRFVPLKYDGTRDDARGLVEFVSGAGGKSHYDGGSTNPLSAFRNTTDFGALFLTLDDGSYSWRWITEAGVVKDTGTGACR